MVMTIRRLKKLCKGNGIKYFVDPDRPRVMFGCSGVNGKYQVVIPIELDGRFVQMRTVGYLHCRVDHPHVNTVLAILGSLNYKLRMTKFGWDPDDGEIVGYVDMWIEDGDLTQKQFDVIVDSLFLPAIDRNFKRLSEAIETGEDPDKADVTETGEDTVSTELRALLDKLVRDKLAEAGPDDDDDSDKRFEKV